MKLNATSLVDCILSGEISCAEVVVEVGYTGVLDFNNQNVTTTGNETFDGAGEVKLGAGNDVECGGDFDFEHQATWTQETAVIILTGTANIIPKNNERLGTLVIAEGAEITYNSGGANIYIENTLTTDGKLSIGVGRRVGVTSGVHTVGIAGQVTGLGAMLESSPGAAGQGITAMLGTWDVANLSIYRPDPTNTVITPGHYNSAVLIYTDTDSDGWAASAGVYRFKSLEFQAVADDFDIDTSLATSITVDDELLFDLNGVGDINFTSGCDWYLNGHVTVERAAAGGLNWTRGLGVITFSLAADQNIDFDGRSIEDVEINKTAGAFILTGGFAPKSLAGVSTGTGSFDPNEQAITVAGNCDLAPAFNFAVAANCMNGTIFIICGIFTADGQTFSATAGWILVVTETATVHNSDVEYCNASFGVEINATDNCTDSGNNTKWLFWDSDASLTYGTGTSSRWNVHPNVMKEILPADRYRDELVIQLHSSGLVFVAFGENAVIDTGLLLGGIGDTVRVTGEKARNAVNAICANSVRGGIEVHTSLEYRHTKDYPRWQKQT